MAQTTKSIGEQMGDLAHAVGDAAGKKAEQAADQSLKMGADLASGLGRKAGALADLIDDNSPSLARQVRDTADKVSEFADELNEKKVSDLVQSAMDFGRAHPFMMMAGAALLGYALARFVGSGSSSASAADTGSDS
ncbi:hypothetical protein [Reyranella sp.]|uniref:hypothetical protein n=1 Tax=Reyranella sp. TaxID=1929291 RepID=UPI0037852293